MPRSKEPKSEYLPMSAYLKKLLSACNLRAYPFTQRYAARHDLKHSTFSDVFKAMTNPDTSTLKKIAQSLADAIQDATVNRLILNPVAIAVSDTGIEPDEGESIADIILRALIVLLPKEGGEAPKARPRKVPQETRMGASELYNLFEYHLYRMPKQDQMMAAAKMAGLLGRIIDKWKEEVAPEKPSLRRLIDAIEENMAEFGATTPKEYAESLFTDLHFSLDHPDLKLLIQGVSKILDEGMLPNTEDEMFGVTIGYLAANLCDGKFEGDGTTMLAVLVLGAELAES